MVEMNSTIAEVTARIRERSRDSRQAYLEMIRSRRPKDFARRRMSESSLAHASAGCAVIEKTQLLGAGWPNIGVITAYNDMLSALPRYYSGCRTGGECHCTSRRRRPCNV